MIQIEELRSLGEPLKTYQFEVVIPVPPGGGIDGESLRLRVDSASIPGIGVSDIAVNAGGHVVHYSDRVTYSHKWKFGVRDYEDLRITQALKAWHALQWDRTTGVSRPKTEYSTDVYVQLLAGDKQPLQTFRLIGCFISDIPEIPLNYTQSSIVVYDVTLTYDYFITE